MFAPLAALKSHDWRRYILLMNLRTEPISCLLPLLVYQNCICFQKAYFAVQLLWGKKLPKEYGPHLAESMLVVLYHIIKGEAVIKEKLGPTPESSGTSSSSAAARAPVETAPQPEINMQHLQQVCMWWSLILSFSFLLYFISVFLSLSFVFHFSFSLSFLSFWPSVSLSFCLSFSFCPHFLFCFSFFFLSFSFCMLL